MDKIYFTYCLIFANFTITIIIIIVIIIIAIIIIALQLANHFKI